MSLSTLLHYYVYGLPFGYLLGHAFAFLLVVLGLDGARAHAGIGSVFAFFGIAVLVWALWPLFTVLFLVAVGYALISRAQDAARYRKRRKVQHEAWLRRQAERAAEKKEVVS